jgi:hypothetical protein
MCVYFLPQQNLPSEDSMSQGAHKGSAQTSFFTGAEVYDTFMGGGGWSKQFKKQKTADKRHRT